MKKAFLSVACVMSILAANAEEIKSPNGNLSLNFEVKDGVPVYELDYKNKPVIKESRLGLQLKDQPDLMDGFVESGVKTSTF
ncbi:MAG: glycoside hydrolase family 97 N-terminal domain-containing protein, partial [Bacteroidales bacterium]